MSNPEKNKNHASKFPEHGPLDENGREILLSLKNIDITFGKGDDAVKAVTNASFDIHKGETFSLVGESGSGKTTIGRAVIRVNPLSAGEIYYKGVPISGKISKSLDREVIRNIQMVFQDPAASLNERATVDYIVSEGLYNFHLYARAMVMEPELVVADEPISALDVSIRAQVLNLMKKFQKEKDVTYLFIAHDLSIVRFISDRIGVIYKGRIVEVADAEELFEYPLHPYTHSLISAIPIPDPKLEKNKVLFTYDPSMHDYSEDKPEFVNIGHDHWVYGNKKEIEEYKKVREAGIPVKSIQILDENTSRDEVEKKQNEAIDQIISDEFLKAPVHDTGNPWYGVLAFFLPIIGIIAALILKKHNYIRNYKVLKKGAIAGFIVIAVLILLLILAIVLAVI